MRWAAKVDENQKEVVEALRKAGRAVLPLHQVGQGCPDLLVSSSEEMWLVEVKSEKGRLTPAQVKFIEEWTGKEILVARTAEEAIRWTR